MNYSVYINSITITDTKMTLSVSGEIEDEQIAEDIYSKPKLILLFDNGKEDRRIPFVISDLGYFGTKCRFSGEYTYMLDMLFWKTRAENLPFTMKFALQYGNYYFDEIKIEDRPPVISYEDEHYKLDYSPAVSKFTPCRASAHSHGALAAFRGAVQSVFYILMYLVGICLLPLYFVEALLAVCGCARLLVAPSGNIIGDIIGHLNRRVERFSTIKITIRAINRVLILFFYKLFRIRKVKPNRISFISARRTDVSGNFAFVYDKLKDRSDLDIRFLLNTKTVRQLSLVDIIKFCNLCATSKVVVLDEFTPQIHFIDLKPETKLVQLWHACGAFKTFGFTRLGKPKGSPQPTRNHRSYDYVTVSSAYCKRCHSEGFGIPYDNVVPTGIPRTDVFFDENYKNQVTEQFYSQYPQLRDKKIIMFAPTFRGDVKETSYYPFEMFDVERFCDSIPDDYVLIIKHHPFITKPQPIPEKYKDRVLDLSASTEINDLLFVTDLIITDYSSLIFEASLLKIPMLFYVFDLDEYIRNRDFYFDLRLNSPGKLVFDMPQLIDAVNREDYQSERMEAFTRMFFDNLDGKSTQRVADLILNALK